MTLRDIAHSRAGDKGVVVNISLIAFDLVSYPLLERHVTADRVRQHLAGIAERVVRYELPHLGALNFVIWRAAGHSVTRTLAIDAHGKSLSSALLSLRLPSETRGDVETWRNEDA